MEEKILNLKNEALAQIVSAKNQEELENLRQAYLGRRGKLTLIIKEIPKLPLEKRVDVGRLTNDAKKAIEETLRHAQGKLLFAPRPLDKEWIDVTAPGLKPSLGHLHLVTQAIKEISAIFEKIGFVRVRYPEVESDWYAFGSLNMPKGHPARDDFETFYISENIVLTPHTSSGQVREMKKGKLPIRMINISKCYRPNWDVSHVPMFYQFEGLVVDKGIAITHLKGTLEYFVKEFFGSERKVRFRPHHFQFTEPSFEVDVSCDICKGKGCRLCKSGWLELGGAGMVHPQVLKNGRVDPQKYSGFAFGWGVERTYMMKANLKIDDIRLIYSGDIRFLNQF